MKIKNLKCFVFEDKIGLYTMKGFAFYEDGKGFAPLDWNTTYSPISGRKALQRILETGGFTGEVFYITPVSNKGGI